LALGAELAYMGTRFIASTECAADPAYKAMCVNGAPEDVVYTNKVSGMWANFIARTIPGMSDEGESYGDLASEAGEKKKWKNIWSAGQGLCLPGEIKPIGAIVRDLVREYAEAVQSLPPYIP
ncbi:MAG: nitronate monooxygenase, partial [Myxococcales bacterium]|nr:nitronate monooxygenase [Myxococcales bacterium]